MATSELFEAIYPWLRTSSSRAIARRKASALLQTTQVANEVSIRLLSCAKVPNSRYALLALIRDMARSVTIDNLRFLAAYKRRPPRGSRLISIEGCMAELATRSDPAIDMLRAALDDLQRFSPRQYRVVTMKFLGGFTGTEIAEQLGVGLTTVEKDWRFARAWLLKSMQQELEQDSSNGPGSLGSNQPDLR